ncbi:hypothetical protein [Limnohabitans radicicola]|uniref:Uncharacterized protein n=1 Tax=Limnohabitans radicicola TaxID=2771427 RepID=A0A927FJA5_9BURK|nr:hypothetical protein [Limnohabitans radicicola]MBD8051087.1 hypothetical protein [Limnohabitans radicicola]
MKFTNSSKKWISCLLACSTLVSCLAIPGLASAQIPGGATVAPAVTPVQHKYRMQCSVNNCFFQTQVPMPVWTEVGRLSTALGTTRTSREEQLKATKGPAMFSNDRAWAALLGLDSNEVSYDMWQKRTGGAPWVIGRYLPEKAQLRVSVMKVIRTAEGMQKALISEWTPEMGIWDIPRRSFLTDDEAYFLGNKGYDPFEQFKASSTDPIFYNISPAAAQVVIGRAMAHHSAPYALLMEPEIRYDQSTSQSGNILRKRITTTTKAYVKPKFYLALPPAFSPAAVTGQAVPMAVYCPRYNGCTHEKHLAWAGVHFDEQRGGSFPEIEEQVYQDVESRSSWTALAYALGTAALTWGLGAIAAGDAAWALNNGAIVSSATSVVSAETAAIAGTTVGAATGMVYLGINTLINGGSATSPQAGWLNETGWRPQDIPSGSSTGSYCTNRHCTTTYDRTAERHLQPPAPGLPGSEANLGAVTQLIQGVCPVSWTAAQCDAAGQASGMMPRADAYDPRPRSSPELYEHNRAACIAAGYGNDRKRLNRCLVKGVD